MTQLRNTSRRAAVGVAVILVLVIAQLVVVGAVLTGAREQDLTVQRVDSTRAFYAAEAGMNMALREVMNGVDEDADGQIGSISADGNAANDPALGSARFTVSRNLVGGATAVVADARSGLARRRADARVQGLIGGMPQTVMAAFGRAGSNVPRYSVWNGSSWGASQAMPPISGEAKWVRMKICPTRNETAFLAEDVNRQVSVAFFNGTSWSAVSLVSTDTGGLNDRPEDVGYEQLSSDGLAVYWKGTLARFAYRTYNGTTFSAEQLLVSPFTTEADFMSLFPRPGSDEILLLSADGIAGGPLMANIWNGTSFGGWTTLVASLETNNEECYGAAFEAQSRHAMVVYAETNRTHPQYRTWNGSSWSAQAQMASLVSDHAKWIRLAADPTSDAILFAALDDNTDITVNTWNGNAWTGPAILTSSTPAYDRRGFDLICERGTGRALIVYAESGLNTFRYRTWNGSAWSAQQTGPNLGSPVEIVALSRGFGNSELFIAVSDSLRRLHLLRWDGLSLSGNTIVENSLSGWEKYYSFAVPEPTPAPHPRVLSWWEIAP